MHQASIKTSVIASYIKGNTSCWSLSLKIFRSSPGIPLILSNKAIKPEIKHYYTREENRLILNNLICHLNESSQLRWNLSVYFKLLKYRISRIHISIYMHSINIQPCHIQKWRFVRIFLCMRENQTQLNCTEVWIKSLLPHKLPILYLLGQEENSLGMLGSDFEIVKITLVTFKTTLKHA